MAEVIWTEPALIDLHDIFEHIARDSLIYAEKFVNRVVVAVKRLELFPYCGRIVPEFNNESIRELIYEVYRIIYVVRKNRCYIVTVIHGSRDIICHLEPGTWEIMQ